METKTSVRDLIPSVTALANHLQVTPNAIYRWIDVDRIPAKHIIKVANFYDRDVAEILQYAESEKLNKKTFKLKPRGTLDAIEKVTLGTLTVEEAAAELGIHPQSIRIAITHWGTKLSLMIDTLRKLDKELISLDDAAAALGVTKFNVHALRRKYGMPPRKVRAQPKANAVQTKRDRTKEAALGAIEGRYTLDQAQAVSGQSWRTVHRWIEKLSPGIGLIELTHWPKSFRLAYSDEIERNLTKIVPNLVKFAENMRLFLKKTPKYPEKQENWRKATTKRMLIAVLTDEESLESIAAARGADPKILEGIFTSDLRAIDLTFEMVLERPVSFQIAVAELLIAIEDRKRKAP